MLALRSSAFLYSHNLRTITDLLFQFYLSEVFKTLDDSLIINSVSKTTRSGGNSVEDSMLRIRISAAFLPISC